MSGSRKQKEERERLRRLAMGGVGHNSVGVPTPLSQMGNMGRDLGAGYKVNRGKGKAK